MTNKKLFAALGLIAKDLRGGDLGGEEGAEGGEESALLTAPARREDNPEHTSYYSNGRKYQRKDGRADGRRLNNPGPTRRNIRSVVAPENITYSSPNRSRQGHSVGRVGIPDLRALVSLQENDMSIYTKDEVQLSVATGNMRRLIEQLESKEAEQDETQQET